MTENITYLTLIQEDENHNKINELKMATKPEVFESIYAILHALSKTNQNSNEIAMRPTELTMILFLLDFYKRNFNHLAFDIVVENTDTSLTTIKAIYVINYFYLYNKPHRAKQYEIPDYALSYPTLSSKAYKRAINMGGHAIIMMPTGELKYIRRIYTDNTVYPPYWTSDIKPIKLSEAIIKDNLTLNTMIKQFKLNLEYKKIVVRSFIFDLINTTFKLARYQIERETLSSLNSDLIDTTSEVILK